MELDQYPKCSLCKVNQATKTNSHIIPSYMIARVCSYDNSGQRDKEVMFTMSSFEDKVYVGSVPDTKIEELFDKEKLTDERIKKELKVNTASKDYMFCPQCESDLSKYLESHYSQYMRKGSKVDSNISYFFWLSIVWRMSVSRQFNFRIPSDIERQLGDSLYDFIKAKKANTETEHIVKACPFRYRLLVATDYLPNGSAYFGGRIDKDRNILSLTLGDRILCVTFNEDPLPEDYQYLGFESSLKVVECNDGLRCEQFLNVKKEEFEASMHTMIAENAMMRLLNEKEKADCLWQIVGLYGPMPDEIFKSMMERLYSEESKQGDRTTCERYVEVFNDTLNKYGLFPNNLDQGTL